MLHQRCGGELFVNGKSQGRVRKDPSQRLDRYRLRWNNVVYEPGELKVVVYDEQGKCIGEQTVRTAGKPAELCMKTETANEDKVPTLKADGKDLAYITVSVLDKDGNEVPTANNTLHFEVSGAGTFQGVCNGDATSLEPFTQPVMKLFNGKLVLIVRAGTEAGTIHVKAIDKKNKMESEIEVRVRN